MKSGICFISFYQWYKISPRDGAYFLLIFSSTEVFIVIFERVVILKWFSSKEKKVFLIPKFKYKFKTRKELNSHNIQTLGSGEVLNPQQPNISLKSLDIAAIFISMYLKFLNRMIFVSI